jgi:hypothetical protein
LPSPLFGNVNIPHIELHTLSLELQALSIMSTINAILAPLLSIAGGSLDSFLPKIPGFPSLNLTSILSGQGLVSAIAGLGGSFTLPGFSNPLYPNLNIPGMAAVHSAQLLARQAINMAINIIPGLVAIVTDIMEIGGMMSIPTLPSIGSILGGLMSLIPPMPNLSGIEAAAAALANGVVSLSAMAGGLSFPGLPSMPSLPSPLIPNLNIPAVDITMMMIHAAQNMALGPLSMIYGFVGGILNVSAPTICLPFG